VEFEVRGSECFLKNGETNANFKTDYRWLFSGTGALERFVIGRHVAPHGWSIIATEIEYVNKKQEQDVVRIRIHLKRAWKYYMYKVLFPMFMIVIVNFMQIFFPVTEFSSKMEHTTALFLSTFALLYVVAADLPKTSFQTPIDWVILFTMVVLACSAIVSVFCAYFAGGTDHNSKTTFTVTGNNGSKGTFSAKEQEERDQDAVKTANFANFIGVTVLTVLYFATVFGLSFPNYLRMRRNRAQLSARSDESDLISIGVDEHVASLKADPHTFAMPDSLYKPWS